MTHETEDKLASARAQGQAQFDSIKEMVEALAAAADRDREAAEQAIHEDALSVEVRSGWYVLGARDADTKPAEYCILLCTGGPGCRIVGQLSEHGEPETAVMEVQDWFQPWTAMRPQVAADNHDSEPTMLAYARCFYFGE